MAAAFPTLLLTSLPLSCLRVCWLPLRPHPPRLSLPCLQVRWLALAKCPSGTQTVRSRAGVPPDRTFLPASITDSSPAAQKVQGRVSGGVCSHQDTVSPWDVGLPSSVCLLCTHNNHISSVWTGPSGRCCVFCAGLTGDTSGCPGRRCV